MGENDWRKALSKIFDAYGISFADENRKEMVTQEIQFLSARYRGEEDLERDEALWTEYAKAALTGLAPLAREFAAGEIESDAALMANNMLTVHKKRWGHE